MKDKSVIKGHVRASVLGSDGMLKLRTDLTFVMLLLIVSRWILGFISLKEMREVIEYQVSINHNIVTNEGDALIVDMLVTTGTQTAVDNANGVIGVGTGFVTELKTTDALVTQTGANEVMDATYPKQKGAFLAADDNVIQYRSTFEAGDLNDTGIDEALLGNGTDTLAYAQITPTVDVSTSDTLQVDWEITFLGS